MNGAGAAGTSGRPSTPAIPVASPPPDYICEGPLLPLCSITQDHVQERLELWTELGEIVAKDLGLKHGKLSAAQRMRIYQYYLPVFFWSWEKVQAHQKTGSDRPLVIGMQAVQGCGKTTLVSELQTLFKKVGLTAASVSIDDFYLTFEDQQKLIKENPDNFLLGVRGNALTHDLELGARTLESLRSLGRGAEAGAKTRVPRYNKSAHEGKGDREPPEAWPAVEAPVDVILFEGWMLGFSPIEEEAAKQISKDLPPINRRLADYVSAWDSAVDAWLVVKVADPAFVFRWRLQAERNMKQAGKGAMTDAQVKDFVDRYMPAYKAYLPGLYEKGPSTRKGDNVLMFEINESRALASCKVPQSAKEAGALD